MPIEQFTVSYDDPERGNKIEQAMRDYGVCVIENFYDTERCDQLMRATVDGITKINPTVQTSSMTKLRKTWTEENLMPQVRPGLFQRGYSFLSWPVRSDPRLIDIFQDVYSRLRGHPVTETVTSLDAVNVRPPIAPFHQDGSDWAHVDQTRNEDPFYCIQGQVVLTNTTAGFRCSPKSHLLFQRLLETYNAKGTRNDHFRLSNNQVRDVSRWLQSIGGEWQIPIIAPKGSVILWFSSVIHSAKLADAEAAPHAVNPKDPWEQWRGVFYVCHRPKEDVGFDHMSILQNAYYYNLTTNHWGDHVFSQSSGRVKHTYAPAMHEYIEKPQRVFSINGVSLPEDENILKLIGMEEW